MGKSLRVKLTIGALGLVVIVCVAITTVVSFIINGQNLQAVQRDLDKAVVITEAELDEGQQDLATEIKGLVVENTIGATVKFFHEYAANDLSITESTYYKTAGIVLKKAQAINSREIGVYDLQGNLQVFAYREGEDTFRFGFFKSPSVHMNISHGGEEFDESAWQHTDQLDGMGVETTYGAEIPRQEKMYYGNREDLLCIETLTPVFANEFDDSGNPVLKQFGFVHAVRELDQSFVKRLGLLTGMSVNVYAGKTLSLGQFPGYREIDSRYIEAGRGDAGEMEKVELKEGTFFQAVLTTFDQRKASGAVALLQSDAILKNNNFQIIKILTIVSLVCLALIIPLVILFSRSIIRPILHLVERMKDIAEGEGDLRGRITITSRDEVGQLAQSFNVFVEKIQTMVGQVKDNLGPLNDSSASLSEIASSLAAGAGQSLERADGVAAAGEEMSANMNSIAAAMEEAATNISMVSENAEQMSETIQEVIENTKQAGDISTEAVTQATKASQQVGALGMAASEIEKVIETITEISEQVNLLALNATIEAARAGEAGKGFAVVANEIKALANQTAEATNEIKKKVADIRDSTDGTVTEIEAITKVNNRINEIIQTISVKVEEQATATSDISENVSQASSGIGEVNENVAQSSLVSAEIAQDIVNVTQSTREISKSSSQVKERSAGLMELSAQLKEVVDRFKV